MATIEPRLQALLRQIDAKSGEFTYRAGLELDRALFIDTLKLKIPSLAAIDVMALERLITRLESHFPGKKIDSEAFFKLVRHGATTGEIPDYIPAFLASAPALTLTGRANTVIGDIWETARSGVEKAGTAIWNNETLRAIAGVVAGTGVGYLAYHFFDSIVRSIGPDVPFLTTAFSFMTSMTAAVMAFTMVRQQFPSNAVIEERERNRAAAPVREKVTSLEPALGAEPELSVRPVMTSHLAGVGFKAAGIRLDNGGAEEVTVPALRGESGVILRG